jgi:group I intron endonuclease
MNKSYCVYKHIFKNGKVYIGLTCQTLTRRFRKNGEGYKRSVYFYNAIKKYGWENIEHRCLIHGLTLKQAAAWEKRLINFYKSNNPNFGYNMTIGGEGNVQSEETIKKRSKEVKSKGTFKGINNPMFGRHHSYETRLKIGIKSKERIKSQGHPNQGKHLSSIVKEKIRLGNIKNSKFSKKVFCHETNVIYPSAREAARQLELDNSCISKCCKGLRKSVKGFTFSYIE